MATSLTARTSQKKSPHVFFIVHSMKEQPGTVYDVFVLVGYDQTFKVCPAYGHYIG